MDWRRWRRSVLGFDGAILLLLIVGLALSRGALEAWYPMMPADIQTGSDLTPRTIELLRSRPAEPGASPAQGTVTELLDSPGRFASGAQLEATLTAITDGGGGNTVLRLSDGDKQIDALYSGYANHLRSGDQIQVMGSFAPSARALYPMTVTASGVRARLLEEEYWRTRAVNAMQVVAGLAMLLTLMVFARRWRAARIRFRARRRSRLALASMALVGLALAGCTVDQTIDVRADGSGAVRTVISIPLSQMDRVRQTPNWDAYEAGLKRQVVQQGGRVTQYATGTDEIIVITRPFTSIADLTQGTRDVTIITSRGSADSTFRLGAAIDTRRFNPADNEQYAAQLKQELSNLTWRFRIMLPGSVYESTGVPALSRYRDGRAMVDWTLPMNTLSQLEVSTQVRDLAAWESARVTYAAALDDLRHAITITYYACSVAMALTLLVILGLLPRKPDLLAAERG